jgi:hypothetical protein
VNGFDPLGSKPIDAKHVDHARRGIEEEFIVKFELSSFDNLPNLLDDRRSDSFDLSKLTRIEHLDQVAGKSIEGSGSVVVGIGAEWIFPLEFQKRPTLFEDLGYPMTIDQASSPNCFLDRNKWW